MVTVGLSVLSYRRGWDLDSVSTPMVTALGDMVTLPTLYLATFLVRNQTANAVVPPSASSPRVVRDRPRVHGERLRSCAE